MTIRKKDVGINYLSRKERIILLNLLKNGRTFNTEIARKLKISSQVAGRIRRSLEKEGKIEGYSVELNKNYLGIYTFVLVLFNVENNDDSKIKTDNLINLYRVIANSITHIGLYAFRNLVESDQFFNSLIEFKDNIRIIDTFIFPAEGVIKHCSRNLFYNAIYEFEGKGYCKPLEFCASKNRWRPLSENEKEVIMQLIKQSNISCKKISSNLNKKVSRSCVNRIRIKMQNRGIITSYKVKLGYEKLGVNVLAFIFVSPEPEIFKIQEELIKKCQKSKYIIGCYRLNEETALFCGFKSLNELEDYSNRIRGEYKDLIKIKHVHIISPKGVIKESFDDLYLSILRGKFY